MNQNVQSFQILTGTVEKFGKFENNKLHDHENKFKISTKTKFRKF